MKYLVLFLLCSCGSIRFEYHNDKKNSFLPIREHTKLAEYEGMKEFYFWGMLPGDQVVEVGNYVKASAFTSIANLEIEKYQTWGDLTWTFLSLGFYIPKHYKVRFYGTY